jgi:hypothetical protein
MRFTIPKDYLYKNESIILNIIAANKWKRPIYFTSNYGELGFGNYVRKDGLSYRLVPVANTGLNNNWEMDKLIRRSNNDLNIPQMDSVMMNKDKWRTGNANLPGVYFDEENRRHLLNIRTSYAELAAGLATKGRKEEARKVLAEADRALGGIDKVITTEKNGIKETVTLYNFPYGLVSRYNLHNGASIKFLEACYKAEDSVLAKKVSASIRKDLLQQQAYYNSLDEDRQEMLSVEKQQNEMYLRLLDEIEKIYIPSAANIKLEQNTIIPPQPQTDSPK